MISLKAGIAISIAVIVVFGGIAFFTLNASTPSLSLQSTGYFSVDNHTEKAYFLNNTSSTLNINFTVYSSVVPIDMYVYDISPVNNTSATCTNITSIGGSYNYEHVNMNSNGTVFDLNMTVNQAAISLMKVSGPLNGTLYPYLVKIIIVSGNDNAAGFGFALFRI